MNEARILEEVQVPPLPLGSVVNLKPTKPGPAFKVHLDVNLTVNELDVHDLPRGRQPKAKSK